MLEDDEIAGIRDDVPSCISKRGSKEKINAELEAAKISICPDEFRMETNAELGRSCRIGTDEHMFPRTNRVAGSKETNCDKIIFTAG